MLKKGDSKQSQWQKIFGYLLGNQAAWVAEIGLKAGVFQAFSHLPEGRITEEALAEKLAYPLRAVQAWCHSAYAFGFLDWDEKNGYLLAPHMAALLLDSSDPLFLGGRIQFYTALNEDFRVYPDFLRSGKADFPQTQDPWLLAALRNLTQTDSFMITEYALPQAPMALARLEAGGKLLDIGAGEGYHIIHYAHRYPKTRVVGLEIDSSNVETARKKVAEAGLGERVEIRKGDANQWNEKNTYDLITMNLTLHEICGPGECRNLLRRVFQALKPGATALISEIPYPDSIRAYRQNPFYKLLSGVQLHLTLVGCNIMHHGQLKALLEETRFQNVREAAQPIPARFVILGEKPGE